MDGLEAMSPEVRSTLLLDAAGGIAAHAGVGDPGRLGADALELLAAADNASARGGGPPVVRLEVSSPLGGVYALRDSHREGESLTLVAVTAPGALSSLVLYDMRMSLARTEES